jgi:hypothetical protein
MYCSSCGGVVSRDKGFCNFCGATLGGNDGTSAANKSETFSENLVWAIVAVFAIGLGTTIGLMAVMKEVVGFPLGWIATFSATSLSLTLFVEVVLIYILMRNRLGSNQASLGAGASARDTTSLDEAEPRRLPEPVPSVTEQTTRTFDHVISERKSS